MNFWIKMIFRLVLGGLFIWAGLSKLAGDPQVFADGVASFRFFPEGMVNGIALVIPALELVAGTLLLTRWMRLGALLALMLAWGFLGLFVWALVQGIAPECVCFGSKSFHPTSPTFGIIRALAVGIASGWLYLKTLQNVARDRGTARAE